MAEAFQILGPAVDKGIAETNKRAPVRHGPEHFHVAFDFVDETFKRAAAIAQVIGTLAAVGTTENASAAGRHANAAVHA